MLNCETSGSEESLQILLSLNKVHKSSCRAVFSKNSSTRQVGCKTLSDPTEHRFLPHSKSEIGKQKKKKKGKPAFPPAGSSPGCPGMLEAYACTPGELPCSLTIE